MIRRLLFAFLLTIFSLIESSSSAIVSFKEPTILAFLRLTENDSISERCRHRLHEIGDFLNSNDTSQLQREYYSAAYATGDRYQFLTREHDRWVYRGRQCLLVSAESYTHASENPMHYCYAYNDDGLSTYGICIPSECAGDHQRLLANWRNFLSSSQTLLQTGNNSEPLSNTGCTNSRHPIQWYESWPSMLEFTMNVVVGTVAILASIYEMLQNANGNKDGKSPVQTETRRAVQIFLAFSAVSNLKRLVAMPKDKHSTITCFFGIRFLSMAWTVIGHSFIFVQAFIENVQDFKSEMVDNFWNQWITNFTLSVDTFFVLSGTLTAYSWFRKWDNNIKENEPSWNSYGYWLRFYRHRLIRLWPAYIFTLLEVTLRASVTYHHPMWPPTDPAVQCPPNWWKNVLFINSLLDNRCMPWTWYIGTEFLFYLISPLFLLSLRRRPSIGWALAIATIATSCCLNALCMTAYNFPPTQFLWKQPEIFNPDFIQHHMIIYIKPHYRIGPYIVGLLLGYYMVGHQRRKQVDAQFSRRTLIVGWIMAAIGFFWVLYGLYPSLQGWHWPFYHLFYGSVHRTVFALAVSWLIFACHFGYGGWINTLLSAPPFIPLSSLCYAVYLFHMIPVVFTYLLDAFPMHFSGKAPLFAHIAAQLAMSYFFGLICTLFAELPALNIERIFLNAGGGDSRKTAVPTAKPPSAIAMNSVTEPMMKSS